MVDTLALDPALLLVVVGSFMFLVTFLGCFGALRNSACLLKTVRPIIDPSPIGCSRFCRLKAALLMFPRSFWGSW